MTNKRTSDMTDDEFIAHAKRVREEQLARSQGEPLGEVNWDKWADPPQLEFSGWMLHLDPGTRWQVTVDGRPGSGEVVGRRRVEDGHTDAVLVRRDGELLALRHEGARDGWGRDEHVCRIDTRDREVPVLAWRVPSDTDPVPAPADSGSGVVTVRPAVEAPGGRHGATPRNDERR